ncbi:MAG: DUF998 domain-containing protein [Chloracidobacterium sp.]|nr:DUF998 domain-containing protein [Chloracidobacterium sp.]
MIVIGVIGIALPFVLAIGANVIYIAFNYPPGVEGPLASSISGYYYSSMGNVFVGGLCAIGVCLGAYCGYEYKDRIAGNFASVFALGVALFPTEPEVATTKAQEYIGFFHYIFAGALFLTLAYFCLALFTMTHAKGEPAPKKITPEKKKENMVYQISGWTILVCIALIGIHHFVLPNVTQIALKWLYPVYWLEAIAVVSFGFSWLTKSKTVFGENK